VATFSHTIGSGGDYAGWDAWQTARIASGDAGSGDEEEAVFLDGTSGGNILLSTSWPSGVTVRMRAQNPHLGDWDVDTQGHRINAGGNGYAVRIAGAIPNNLTFEVVDFVLSGSLTNSFRHGMSILSSSGTGVTVALRRCLVTSGPTADCHGMALGAIAGNMSIILDNVCAIGQSTNGTGLIQIFNNCNATVYVQSSYIESFIVVYNSAGSFNWVVDGSIFGANPGNATSRVATDSICATNWTGWTTTNCAVATLVSGTPASGQVGFEDISADDYRLVDHPDNLAIDYVTNATVPAYDILGATRDATPDCGPFEVVANGDVAVTPGIATATLTTFAPTVVSDVVLVPGVVTATLTAQTPTVVATAHITLVPGVGELVATPFAPAVVVTADVTLVPGTATATLTPYAPTIVVEASITLEPGPGSLTLTPHAPTVATGDNQVVEPGAGGLTLTPQAPTVTVTTSLTAVPGAATLTITAHAPTVTVSTAVTLLTPDAGVLELLAHAPVVTTTAPVTVVTDGVPEGAAGQESVGVYPQRVALQAGDEWFITLSGPAADAPAVRVVVRFRE
jgi:hypothetical protein